MQLVARMRRGRDLMSFTITGSVDWIKVRELFGLWISWSCAHSLSYRLLVGNLIRVNCISK